MRWFDVIRNKLTVTHVIIDVNDPTQRTTLEIKPDDPRRVFQIPLSAKQAGLALNPR